MWAGRGVRVGWVGAGCLRRAVQRSSVVTCSLPIVTQPAALLVGERGAARFQSVIGLFGSSSDPLPSRLCDVAACCSLAPRS